MTAVTRLCKKGLATFLAAAVAWTPANLTIMALRAVFAGALPAAAWADPFTDAASEGQSLGRELASGFQAPQAGANGEVLFPDSGVAIDPNSLFSEPGSGGASASDWEALYGDDDAMTGAGVAAQERLSTEQSATGEAYRTLRESAALQRPNLENDPIWVQTDYVTDNIDPISAGFADCSEQTVIVPGEISARVPDYRQCERVIQLESSCTLKHDYSASAVIKYVSGPLNLQSCGEGCLDLWIGHVGDDYWSGNCTIYERSLSFDVVNPDAITSARLVYAKWDDYMQVWLNGQKIWQGPNNNFPPETSGPCELGTRWIRNPNVDVTPQFKAGGLLQFKIRVSIGGKGDGYAKLRVQYDPTKLVTQDEWGPDYCLATLRAIQDGFCTNASYSCTSNPDADGDGCAVIDGVRVCEDMLGPSPVPGISNLCRQVSVTADCGFNQGTGSCWTDPQGNQQCLESDGSLATSCTEYEQDPSCGFVSSRCVDGAKGPSGQCYVQEETWDCGYDVSVPTATRQTAYQCAGPVRCMGTECVQPDLEQSTDFARAAAMLQAAEFIRGDMTCTQGTEQNVTCEVFKGEPMECKKAVGGIQDCCETPDGVSLANYISLLLAMNKLMGMDFMEGTALRAAWEKLRYPFDKAWDIIKEGFSTAWDSLTGTSAAAATNAAKEASVESIKQKLMKKTYEWVADTFGPEVANLFFEPTIKNGVVTSVELGGTIGTALNWIMTAYTVYLVTMLLIQIIWACEEEEFLLGAKRQLKVTHYVGSYCRNEVLGFCVEKREVYCAFNSPLSRIIQEQARAQLGLGWGSPRNPDCRGLTLDEIQSIDWDRVDLSEWLAILKATGNWPGDRMNVEDLTGAGSNLATDVRENIINRTRGRIEGIDVGSIRQQAREEVRSNVMAQ